MCDFMKALFKRPGIEASSSGLESRLICYLIMADILSAAKAGDLSALRVSISRGEDVNSVNRVSWFVGM